MKIFTWMHCKLHNNADYSKISREKGTFAGNSRSRALHVHEKEAEAFQRDRDNESLFNVLGDSILAIGTFGVDQFKSLETLEGYFAEEEEYSVGDGEEEEEDGELNPVAVKADLESEPLLSFQHDNPLSQFLELTEFGNDDAEEKKRKKRKTLADLFNEESAAVAAEKSTATKEVSAGMVKKWKSVQPATKNVRSLSKKLMPWKNEDSSPTAKLHRLIRKMLKSKIHPELESKANGDQVGYSNAALKIGVAPGGPGLDYDPSVETAGNESFYLLQGVVS